MTRTAIWLIAAALTLWPVAVRAHSGPPYPIVSDRETGPYRVSIWTDPDTTDDGTPGGQFWVRIDSAREGVALPSDTRAAVTIRSRASDTSGLTAPGVPVNGDITNQFAALNMNREGPFAVHVAVNGPLGRADIETEVNATYDLRPPPLLIVVYAMPFVLAGLVWLRVLIRRR